MRRAMVVLIATVLVAALAGCTDLRQYEGAWRGARVGDAPELRVGIASAASATLAVDDVDAHGLRGRLSIDGLVRDAEVASVPGAEADALSGLTFTGSPLRVYLAFVPATDQGGNVLVVISLYDERRIEIRALRGDPSPIYAIFTLTEA